MIIYITRDLRLNKYYKFNFEKLKKANEMLTLKKYIITIFLFFIILLFIPLFITAAENIGKIEKIQGQTEISYVEGIWLPCSENAEINLNTSIRTNQNSSVSIIFSNGKTVKLNASTILKVTDIIKSEYLIPEITSQSFTVEGDESEKKVTYSVKIKNIKQNRTTVTVMIYNEFDVLYGEHKMSAGTIDEKNYTAEYYASVTINETGKYSQRYKIICAE
ncbi:hypothetical protein KA977_07375 [Candidatus Dependentiae bacterium]|nr:hypothetical protein [Candidatus Dependentiae bacterium]